VSVDTTTVSSGVETIDVGDEEDDSKLPGATTAPFAGTPRRPASTEEQAMEMPRRTSTMEERPRSREEGKEGSSKPCKPGLRSATK
jgi:hypothetical protein